ncbi:hypothetical protein NLN94_23385 [Citrobacter portucalensis]|uniref:ECs_2282 family putative zinc-binding protein n=1 Tax=Citrobacter portucalensis TaxID=1639133 RepID=UPI00226B1B4B|nr:hypothetical protein [Citrobacter portucalensis]MCX9063844.1 hypothetical protein [Citrobacter portucalensis]
MKNSTSEKFQHVRVNYKCPKCGYLTELPDIESIRNSSVSSPAECKQCGTKFRKEELLRFIRYKAEQLVKAALAKMQKHITVPSGDRTKD